GESSWSRALATCWWCGQPARAVVSVFFFQAEDGIRDFHVTGVQSVLFRSAVRCPWPGLWTPESPTGRPSACGADRRDGRRRSPADRKSVVEGKSVDLGEGPILKNETPSKNDGKAGGGRADGTPDGDWLGDV